MKNTTSHWQHSVLRRIALLASFTGLLVALAASPSCKHDPREPNIEIEGDGSWYDNSKEEKEYLLKAFQAEERKTISWPPEALARYVDISIDVTKSGFDSKILYKDSVISWAEYNVHKFAE